MRVSDLRLFLLTAMSVAVASCQQNKDVQSESLLRMKAQCQQAGAQARARWVKQYPGETFSDEPEYGYSSQMHTCLYADAYSDEGLVGRPREVRFVLDVYANRVILELMLQRGVPIPSDDLPFCKSEHEFTARKAQLFAR